MTNVMQSSRPKPHRLKLSVAAAFVATAASDKPDYHCFIRNEGLPRNRSVNTIEIMARVANYGIVGTKNA